MKVNPIPEKYLINAHRCRSLSDVEIEFRTKKAEDFVCPSCGTKSLRLHHFDDVYEEECVVGCDSCDWECPVEHLSDVGEAIALFKEWYAAWILIGKPPAFVEQNCARFFDPKENKLLIMMQADDLMQKDSEEITWFHELHELIKEGAEKYGYDKLFSYFDQWSILKHYKSK